IFESEAALKGRPYTRILSGQYRWSNWVSQALGEKDPATGRRKSPKWTADDLLPFIHGSLFQYLRSLSGSPEREVIAGVFAERNVIVCASPYNLKDVLEIVDNIDFKNPDDIHTVSHVYEVLLQRLSSENRLAGEFYTPRPVVRFIVQVVNPTMGETVYDPACGSAGFLAEAYEHLRKAEKSRKDYEILQLRPTQT
ncbi:MAG: N-6 DNA methylase, partial [Thermodesulfobacteriota bacterium]